MRRLEVSCAVRRIYTSLGAKGLNRDLCRKIILFRGTVEEENKRDYLLCVRTVWSLPYLLAFIRTANSLVLMKIVPVWWP